MKNEKLSFGESMKISNRMYGILWKRYPKMMVSQLIAMLWNAVTPYVSIYLSALVIGELAGNRNPKRLLLLVLITLSSALLIGLVSTFLAKWQNVCSAGQWWKIQNIFAEKLLQMEFSHVDNTKTHELLRLIRQNENSNGWGIHKLMRAYQGMLSSLFTVLGGISLTVSLFTAPISEGAPKNLAFLTHPGTVVLFVVIMIVLAVLSSAFEHKSDSYFTKSLGNLNFINQFGGYIMEKGELKKNAADMRIYEQHALYSGYLSDKTIVFGSKGLFSKLAKGPIGLFGGASSAVTGIFAGIAYTYVCLKAWAGAFGLGDITRYIGTIVKMSDGIRGLISSVGLLMSNAPFVKIIFSFLDIENTMYQGSLTVEKRNDRDYEVEFRDVSFRYPGAESYALRHVNMKFKIGNRLAIVGRNGSGKTTFIKLLCRLYDPTEGEILLNGINIKKYRYDEYMQVFSIVFQDFHLPAMKLSEIVASGRECDKARVEQCLQKAGFADRLASLENGMETYIGKGYDSSGIDVSGGEAQKIAIARSLYKNAPFIILDEPTAALDPIAEAEIYSKFDEIAGDKTAIYISHRLSSCVFCDEIAVFENGSVVEYGTHRELLQNESSNYYKLWHAQAQYYTE